MIPTSQFLHPPGAARITDPHASTQEGSEQRFMRCYLDFFARFAQRYPRTGVDFPESGP